MERRALLLGLDAVQRIDLSVQPKEVLTSYERIREAILRVARPERFQQPNGGDGE